MDVKHYFRLVGNGARYLKNRGLASTCDKVKRQLWIELTRLFPSLPEKMMLRRQRKQAFPCPEKISVIVPLRDTPGQFLRETLRSVKRQTYKNWQLCLADGSDGGHVCVRLACVWRAMWDRRVVYRRLRVCESDSELANACADMATGTYIGLLEQNDRLHPSALYEVMRAICAQGADMLYTDEDSFDRKEACFAPQFKPDFAPDTLRSYNYIRHFCVFKRSLLGTAGGFRSGFDGSWDYDLILRLTESAEKIVHIPRVLYHRRSAGDAAAESAGVKTGEFEAARRAVQDHLERVGLKGEVLEGRAPHTQRVRYDIEGRPLVTILIPNKDHRDDLEKCVSSIRERSSYTNWEIVIVENNSEDAETFAYYAELQKDPRIRVVTWTGPFNYAAINDFGAGYARGEHLLLLNNDTEVISPDWIEQMLMFSQRGDVGAVGAMLYYPDDTVQHAGVIIGIGGFGGHAHRSFPRGGRGYMDRLAIAQDLSAVTAACMMVRRDVWEQIGGLDESFAVAINDVDLCLRIRRAGYLIVWTPFAELYHYESKTRGLDFEGSRKERFEGEIRLFRDRWEEELKAGDPYYNPNLTLAAEDFAPAP